MKVLSNYILLRKMAAGGMAELYKARKGGPDADGRLFAAKMVLPHLADSGEFVKMLVDEAKVASHLDHGNIVRIHDLVKADNTYCIVMEYVRGKDLRKVITRSRKDGLPPSVGNACAVAAAVLDALSYAHSKKFKGEGLGIVHRDVSPQNIIVSYDGTVKLTDFGIARAAGRDTRTKTGVLKGKFAYMSPEQARGKAVDARSDLFSLGGVMYEMLTGRKLFKDESEIGTLRKVWAAKVEALPSALNGKVSPALDAFLLKALAKEPEERYPSAAAMLDALKRLVKKEGIDAGPAPLASFMGRLFGKEIEAERKEDEELLCCGVQADGEQDTTRLREGVSLSSGPSLIPEAADDAPAQEVPPMEAAPSGRHARVLKYAIAATVLLLVLAGIIHKPSRPARQATVATAPAHSPAPAAVVEKAERPARRPVRPTRAVLTTAIPQAPAGAVASISSVPVGALVYVDGIYAGRTPLDYKDIQDGKNYSVIVVKSGYQRWSGSFTGSPGLRETLHAELKKESRKDDIWSNIFPKVPSSQTP